VKLARRGATITLGLRAYVYLALAQYLADAWDDVLLTAEQGFSAAAIHTRRYELPLLHLAAGCVPTGRGAAEEAERRARLAEEAADSLDYGQEKLYAAMARALVYQAAGDYLGMADALGHWRDDAALDGRSRACAVLWRPLLIEGLVGSGQTELAAAVLDQLREGHGEVGYLRPGLAWLEGWLAEQRDAPEEARRIYSDGEESGSTQSPVYAARLLLAHGRLLRRTGQRRLAVERLRQAYALFHALRAAPFIARAEEELAACHFPGNPAKKKQSVLVLTSRETEVAHLAGRGCPTRRSRPSCSSAARPWSTTWATSTPSADCGDGRSFGASSSNGASQHPYDRFQTCAWNRSAGGRHLVGGGAGDLGPSRRGGDGGVGHRVARHRGVGARPGRDGGVDVRTARHGGVGRGLRRGGRRGRRAGGGGVALGCPCHRPRASTIRPASTAVPMTVAQIWNQDVPLPCQRVLGWLVACRSGA
jgi:hypothetical protein